MGPSFRPSKTRRLIYTQTLRIRLGESFAFNLSRSQCEWAGLLDIFVRFYCQGGANGNVEVKRAVCGIRSLQTEERDRGKLRERT